MTAEVALNSINLVSPTLLIVYGFVVALLLIVGGKYVLPYLGKIKYILDNSESFRNTLSNAVPSVKKTDWIVKWKEWEFAIREAVRYAETFKTDSTEESQKFRHNKVTELLEKWGIDIDDSQKELLDDAIDMAVATDAMFGKVALQKIPIQSSTKSTSIDSKV